MQTNPWRELPMRAPFVLPGDRLAVDVFNKNVADGNSRLHTETPPEPFLGRLDAPIVVLLLNPGVSKTGEYDATLADMIRAAEKQTDHFYLVRDNRWWDRLVRQLRCDRPRADLGKSILSIEFFPYRSISFGCAHLRLPSQEFSFALVRQAISRRAAIIVARGERHWIGAVPELGKDSTLIRMGNPRVASLSATNLGMDGYQRLLNALDRS
jgi:hypothetical protein